MTGILASLAGFLWAVQFISERSVVAGLRRFSTKATAVRVAPAGGYIFNILDICQSNLMKY